jgi:lysophospholipase L1-like esterase
MNRMPSLLTLLCVGLVGCNAGEAVGAGGSATSPTPSPTLASPTAADAWFKFSQEGDRTTVPVLSHLRFGTPRAWVYKDATGDMTCSAEFFGADPNPGVSKQCQTTAVWAASIDVKLMPIGDSITGFYRNVLWSKIRAAGFESVDFVGSSPYKYHQRTDPDNDHNGYGGYAARNLLKPAGAGVPSAPYYLGDARDLPVWMEGHAPDLVLLHLGTNDYINVNEVLVSFTKILGATRQRNKAVKFFVAQIIPAVGRQAWNVELNAAIASWAAASTTTASPVVVVDQYTGFDAATMTTDGTHPNEVGAQQMANRWLAAIRPYLR